MKTELIKISKEFKGMMGGLWLGKEISIQDGDDEIQCFLQANEQLEKAWMAMNPQINWSNGSEGKIFKNALEDFIPQDEKISGMKELLNLCTTKQLLERQRGQVERLANKEVTELFESKLKSFQ